MARPELRIYRKQSSVLIKIKGVLTRDNVSGFRQHLETLVGSETQIVYLCLKDVEFIDSYGFSLLMMSHLHARRNGRRLVLLDPRPSVVDLIRMTRLGERWEVLCDEKAEGARLAIEAFTTPVIDSEAGCELLDWEAFEARMGEVYNSHLQTGMEFSMILIRGNASGINAAGSAIDPAFGLVIALIRSQLRESDVLGSFGNGQFAVLLPGMGSEEVRELTGNLRSMLKDQLPGAQTAGDDSPEPIVYGTIRPTDETLEHFLDRIENEVQGSGGD